MDRSIGSRMATWYIAADKTIFIPINHLLQDAAPSFVYRLIILGLGSSLLRNQPQIPENW